MASFAKDFREHVRSEKFVIHKPYEMGAEIKQGSLVRIPARVSDAVVELNTSYLRVTGTVTQTNKSALKTVYATNGFAGGLFAEIRLYLGTELLETCRNPLFMSLFTLYVAEGREHYDTTGRLFPGFMKNGKFFIKNRFECYIPLRYFLSVCRDNHDPIFYSNLELAVQISNDDFINCFAREKVSTPGADGVNVISDSTETYKLAIEEITWSLKHIHLESSAQTKVMNSITKGLKQNIEFNSIDIYSIPPLATTANTARIPIKCYSQVSAPLFVIVGFQENRLGNVNLDSSVCEDVVIESVSAWLNANCFPPEGWTIDRTKDEVGSLYQAYCDFCKQWRGSDQINYTLTRKQFDDNFQVFCIPTPVKKNLPILGAIDMSLEVRKSNNFLDITTVTVWVGQRQRWSFDALRSELIRLE
jgi:hypothetical protein